MERLLIDANVLAIVLVLPVFLQYDHDEEYQTLEQVKGQ